MRDLEILYCGYRNWALEVYQDIKKHPRVKNISLITDNDELINSIISFKSIDIIIFVGWSWFIPDNITENILCLGVHPSDLPFYRGGSPIQNQIIDGIIETKCSLFRMNKNIDSGDIWLKTPLSLKGDNMDQIFTNIISSTKTLLNKLFDLYPNIIPIKNNLSKGCYCKRRKPNQSKITAEEFKNKSLLQLYNLIRSLTDPYPNAFIEDNDGNRLYLTGVKYERNTKND